jgi:zinc transport system substrate-binding protein
MRLFFIVFSLLSLLGCSRGENVSTRKPRVVVSLPPYIYFVERIAGEDLTVSTLVPLGSNPHLFEPTPRQVQEVGESLLWVRLHESFEYKIDSVLKEQNPRLLVVDLCEQEFHEEDDHHFWLSPKRAQKQAEAIAQGLIQLYPERESLYRKNLDLFLKDLRELDIEIAALLDPCRGQAILTSHPAFGYFCENYGLEQLSIECEGKDPLPQDFAETLALTKIYRVRSVLLQPQHNNKGAELVAAHLSLPVHTIDPYTSDYIQNLRLLAQLIVQNDRPSSP